ncbi:MAG: PHP domain-containing protein [Victivallales bacterium]|nr:PHP domain-containing protein [Victivallales bacterium]
MIDLHVHSTASDGSHTPEELVSLAAAIRLKAIALTDHDTADGLKAFLAQAESHPEIELIPGIELAALEDQEAHQNLHIVGLYLKELSPRMERLLTQVVSWRHERNLRMIEKISALGMPITLEDVQRYAGGMVIGRPHIACAMVEKGYVSSLAGAFERFLASGKPGYEGRRVPSCSEAIAAIHSCGGVAIWAHPYTRGNFTRTKIRRIALNMKSMGLDGMEAYYSLHTPVQCQNVLNICREIGLLPSGGSDFHGSRFKKLDLGTGYGNLAVPDDILPGIREAAAKLG